ncbi:hypothetical protein DFH29DRAFT_879692 [Suillus ampliporus]|nr:hypothetical protein DFH29DRAFT_879692 [Suillus ampliporus]
MAYIMSDPVLDIEPDFVSLMFEGIRNWIIGNTQAIHAKVANKLIMSWQQDQDLCLAAWTLQVNEEACLAAEAAQAKHDRLKQDQLLLEREAKNEYWEIEKKKLKIKDFKVGISITDTLTHRPSQYAIHKLKSFKYIKMRYFSPDGCKDTANEAKSSADGTFSFMKVDDFVALKAVASSNPLAGPFKITALNGGSSTWRRIASSCTSTAQLAGEAPTCYHYVFHKYCFSSAVLQAIR